MQLVKIVYTAVAVAERIRRKGCHRAALCPSSALQPTLGHTCDSEMMEQRYLHSRYYTSRFSTSLFYSKLLFTFKIDFIFKFQA